MSLEKIKDALKKADTVRLSRHHAQGNEFLIALAGDQQHSLPNSHFLPDFLGESGADWDIGTDGLIYSAPVETHSAPASAEQKTAAIPEHLMALFNADGSRAEISGNGLRCLCQALAQKEGLDRAEYKIHTDAGIRNALVRDAAQDISYVNTEMGTPHIVYANTLETNSAASSVQNPVNTCFITLGNPHLVIQVEDISDLDIEMLGKQIMKDALVSGLGELNIELIAFDASISEVEMKVYERGVGVTKACGSGAVASVSALHHLDIIPDISKIDVKMEGGTAEVEIQEKTGANPIYRLGGSVNFVELLIDG